jgi:hypothetical protein
MDKNRILGLPGRTSEQMIAKSTAIKDRGGKSGGGAFSLGVQICTDSASSAGGSFT